jgi:7 transmembrane helices usually fused to an inactive transglutaminase/Transglutaminase-like superfamily
MSRTTLCVVTAAGLVTVSSAVMIARCQVLGSDVKVPAGPGTWRVQMLVNGKSVGSDARLLTATPLDFGRQHVLRESCRSNEFLNKPPDLRHPERRQVLWVLKSGASEGPFRATYEFYCAVDVAHPSRPMSEIDRELYGTPRPGEDLDVESRDGTDNQGITTLARRLTAALERPADQAEALFRYVDKTIANEPNIGGPAMGATECLKNGRGDCGAKSRLFVALLRNRGIPARLITGLTLTKGPEQLAHSWAEAWIHDHWVPMCTFYHHFGHVPATFLVLGVGDLAMARGRQVKDLDYAFLVERAAPESASVAEAPSPGRRLFVALSLFSLPPAEQRLVEFLLLLPIAALIVCIYRNIIGLQSFGTFAPALVGLAFRDLHSLPGMLVFVSIVLVGWLMRRVLDYYRLLQVPRTAFLLSLVVILLIGVIVVANDQRAPVAATQYVSLFPMVILTGMIERFWTLETEDSTVSSFRTLVGTMLIAASIGLCLSMRIVANYMFRFPEALGFIMACQLLLGRYTGYRLSELLRFRDFVRQPAT